MKSLSAILLDLMSRDGPAPFLLIDIGPNPSGEHLRFTTLPYDFVYDANTYETDSGLAKLDPPAISSLLEKGAYGIGFHDPDYLMRPFFESSGGSQIIGTDILLLGGFINTSESPEYGADPGQSYGEYFVVYEGYLNSASYKINLAEETLLLIEGAAPMAALEMRRSILTSQDFIQQQYPTYTDYDELYEGSDGLVLKWGKIGDD